MKNTSNKKCSTCLQMFETKHKSTKTCSLKCRKIREKQYNYMRRRKNKINPKCIGGCNQKISYNDHQATICNKCSYKRKMKRYKRLENKLCPKCTDPKAYLEGTKKSCEKCREKGRASARNKKVKF